MAAVANVRLAGIAAAVPPLRVVEWSDLGVPEDRFSVSRRVGWKPTIRAAAWEQCQSDFCHRAATDLLDKLGWAPAEVDVVILVTLTPDYPIPATAIILQDRLGLKKTALAFDLPGGEATFLHGLQLLASMLSAGHLKRGLLLCGGVSKVVEGPESIESVDHICGHNGSVCALEYAPDATPMFFQSGGEGAAHQSFFMPIGGTRRPPEPEMFASADAATAAAAMQYALDLPAVEATALRELPDCLRAVLAEAGRESREIDHFFLQPITLATDEALRNAVGFSRDQFHSQTREFGRGGSGSIVLAMLARASRALAGRKCMSLLAGIGAGLAWGGAVISTENVVCLEPIEM